MKSSKSYAVALMDLCKENNNDLNKVVSDLQLVYSLFDEDFVKFLKFPKIIVIVYSIYKYYVV